MEIVIVGGGISALNTVNAIRRKDNDSPITIISSEGYLPYTKIMLAEYMAAEKSEDDLFIKRQDFYDKKNVKLILNTKVTKVDAEAKKVITDNDEAKELSYDKCVLAVGAEARVLPFAKGNSKAYTLRNLNDAKTLKSVIGGETKVLIVGGGLLGLELAYNVKDIAKSVAVLEIFQYLLPRQIDKEGAEILHSYFEGMGIKLHLGVKTENEQPQEGSLKLQDGSSIDYDVLLIQAGVVPNKELAENSGINTNKGIIVDDGMETNLKDVYAVGDCTEHKGKVYGIIPACIDQASAFVNALYEGEKGYNGTVPKTKLKVAGSPLLSFGTATDTAIECESCVEGRVILREKDENKKVYKKAVVDDGKLTGAVILGSEDLTYFNKNTNKEIDIDELKRVLKA